MSSIEFRHKTWEEAADNYIEFLLGQLRDTYPGCVLPPTWAQLREEIDSELDDYETSGEPWPDDPDGRLWNEFIDRCMEALRPEIEKALKPYRECDFVNKFWGKEGLRSDKDEDVEAT